MYIKSYKKPTKQMYSYSHLRTRGFLRGYQVFDLRNLDKDGRPTEIIKVKIWQPGTIAYCAIWVRIGGDRLSTGKAGGGGYDKVSAALEIALINRGYTLQNRSAGAFYRADLLYEFAKSLTGYKTSKSFLLC